MKLNVGAGKNPLPGYVNIDIIPQHPDVQVGSALALSVPDKSCSEVFASHLIEHLTKPELVRFFREAKRVLQRGGVLKTVAPSMTAGILEWVNGHRETQWLEEFLFGRQEHPQDYHRQGIYGPKLRRYTRMCGLRVLGIQERNVPGSPCEIVMEAQRK